MKSSSRATCALEIFFGALKRMEGPLCDPLSLSLSVYVYVSSIFNFSSRLLLPVAFHFFPARLDYPDVKVFFIVASGLGTAPPFVGLNARRKREKSKVPESIPASSRCVESL